MRIALMFIFAGVVIALGAGMTGGVEQDEIRPFHAIHAENDFACEDCHSDAASSLSGLDALSPTMAFCSDCHDVEDADECSVCHSDASSAVSVERMTVAELFPHAIHVQSGMECSSCHEADAAGEPVLPAKTLCRSCHVTASGMDDCSLCHSTAETLIPVSHTPEWGASHADVARFDQISCQNCHTQTDCLDCHSGDNVRPSTHTLNFAFDHALEARDNELKCQTCHLEPQFCSDCHLTEQVLPRNHSRADWILGGNGGTHAEDARFNMESCVACHDAGNQAPICAACHGD